MLAQAQELLDKGVLLMDLPLAGNRHARVLPEVYTIAINAHPAWSEMT